MGLRGAGFRRWLVAGVAAGATLLAGLGALAPATGAVRGHDLAVTKVQFEFLPSPPYLLIGRSGLTQRLVVRVVTRNAGDTAVGPSEGRLDIEDGEGNVYLERPYTVDGLAPGQSGVTTVRGTAAAKLGFLRLVATADPAHRISDSNRNNNVGRSERVPVASRVWDAKAMSVSGETATGNFVDQVVRDELYFRFSYFDGKQFRYNAIGEVKAVQKIGGACSGTGEKTASHNPWPTGGLAIDYNLDAYQAVVPASHEPAFKFPVYCAGHYVGQMAATFVNLVTAKGGTTKQPMRPSATSLVGGSQSGGVRYSWLFRARIP